MVILVDLRVGEEEQDTSVVKCGLGKFIGVEEDVVCRSEVTTTWSWISQPSWKELQVDKKGNLCSLKWTFLETKTYFAVKSWTQKPLEDEGYPRNTHSVALESNLCKCGFGGVTKHWEPKIRKWSKVGTLLNKSW